MTRLTRNRLRLSVCLGLALVYGSLGIPRIAGAQAVPSRAGEPAEYRRLVDEAVAEFAAEHYAESRALFAEAHALLPNARTARGLGMVEFELRNYGPSIHYLQEALASNVRKLNGEQRAQTELLLGRARTFVSPLTLVTEPAQARVLIDGTSTPIDASKPLWLVVGDHTLEVQADGYTTDRRMLSVPGKEALNVTIRLRPGPENVTQQDTTAQPGAQEPQATASSRDHAQPAAARRSKGAGPWVLTGISAATLAAGAVLLGIGFSDIAAVENANVGTPWSEVANQHDRAPILTGTGFALSAVGIVGLTAGLIWGLKEPRADRSARARQLVNGRF